MVVILRETATNRYSVNTLTAILDDCGVEWVAAATPDAVATGAVAAARKGRVAIVGYSFMTPDLGRVRAEVAFLRRAAPAAVLIAGGPHASADPEGTLAAGFHHVFAGEAERTLPAFLDRAATAPPVIDDPAGPLPHLDFFPPFGRGRTGPVELARGCPYGCRFCAVGRGPVRYRSPDSVREAGARLRRAGRNRMVFVTPNACRYGSGLAALEGLLLGLRQDGILPVLGAFPSEVRPEAVIPEVLAVLRRLCHNRTLVIGAQSGSDAVLRRLQRGHTVADVIRAAHAARRFGFRPHLDLIFGLPEESAEERWATLELARRLRRESGARLHVHYFHPLPGTPLWGRDPTPLDAATRLELRRLRSGGAEDGHWEEQERWSREILDWARIGLIRTPR